MGVNMRASNERKAVIDETLAIQALVKQESTSYDALHKQLHKLGRAMDAYQKANYTSPMVEVERKKLIDALENSTDYELVDADSRTIFACSTQEKCYA